MEENLIEQPVTEPETLSENSEGSILGKFKDAKTLLDAYNSLQAEFTRKSQKLAEFQTKLNEFAFFEKEDDLNNVLKDETDSDKYKKEITEILSQNEDLYNLPNKNRVAFKIIKLADSKIASNLNNPKFVDEYLFNNQDIKNKIISEYLSTLNNISSTPNITSGNSSNIYFSPNSGLPKTIREAGEIFTKMLK